MKNKVETGKSAHFRGHLCEHIASGFLRLKGYRVIGRNLRAAKGSGASEIDIIASKDDVLAFVEVKQRKAKDDAYRAVSERMKKRLINAALLFVAENPIYKDYQIRFDAVLFADGLRFEHVKAAFTA